MSVARWASVCALVTTAFALSLPGQAFAGAYRVYSCKTPAGSTAPTDGWSASSIAPFANPTNSCSVGGSLTIALAADINNPATASLMTWRWDAPAGTTITSYRVWRNARTSSVYEPNATPVIFVARPVNVLSGAYVSDGCRASDGCPGLGGDPGIHAGNLLAENLEGINDVTRWFMNVDCGGVAGYWCVARPAGVPMASASIFAAEFTLRDSEAPGVSEVTGRLAGETTHSGVEIVSYRGMDTAAGVYRTLLEIDGKIVKTAIADANDGRCADAGVDASTPYEFLYREPCRKSVKVDMTFDTRTVADGDHNLRVLSEDAAGNRTTVLTNPQFSVRNATPADTPAASAGVPGQAGGTVGASPGAPTLAALTCTATSKLSTRFAGNDATRRTVRHGSKVTYKGRGPANADIDAFHVRGTKVRPLGSFRTSASGSFRESFRARYGSGTIRLCGPGVAASLTLRVKAKVSLKVRIGRRGLVRYSGRVATGQIPKGGKIIVIQGKAGRSWQTFALRRTDRKGRFKGRYRLRVVVPGAKLKFRVRVPGEAGYPFVGVVSKAQTKRVR